MTEYTQEQIKDRFYWKASGLRWDKRKMKVSTERHKDSAVLQGMVS